MMALIALLFVTSFLSETAYVRWTLAAVAGQPVKAAMYSGAIQLVGLTGLVLVVYSPWLIIPGVLGHAAGSYLAVRQ